MKKKIIIVKILIILMLVIINAGCVSLDDDSSNDHEASNNFHHTEDLNNVEWMPDGSYAILVGEKHVWKYQNDNFLIEMNEDETDPIEFNGNYGDITTKGKIYILTSDGRIKLYSGDGAWNYVTVHSPVSLSLNSMDCNINDDMLIVGNHGTILTGTQDELNSGITKNLNSVSWNKNGTEALIVGDEGTVILYKNSIVIDLSEQVNGSFDLHGVSWNAEDYALIVGEDGIVLGYKNGEITTNLKPDNQAPKTLYDIMWKPNDNYAIIVGEDGLILKYYLNELIRFSRETENTLMDISWKPDGSLALIVGEKGTILMTEDGDIFDQL